MIACTFVTSALIYLERLMKKPQVLQTLFNKNNENLIRNSCGSFLWPIRKNRSSLLIVSIKINRVNDAVEFCSIRCYSWWWMRILSILIIPTSLNFSFDQSGNLRPTPVQRFMINESIYMYPFAIESINIYLDRFLLITLF